MGGGVGSSTMGGSMVGLWIVLAVAVVSFLVLSFRRGRLGRAQFGNRPQPLGPMPGWKTVAALSAAMTFAVVLAFWSFQGDHTVRGWRNNLGIAALAIGLTVLRFAAHALGRTYARRPA